MAQIQYVQPDGQLRRVDVPEGATVMEGAVKNMVDGIVAECGGACACATCHVYVDPSWISVLSPPNPLESEMLECTAEPASEGSRLSCQLTVKPEYDGLLVRIPKTQC